MKKFLSLALCLVITLCAGCSLFTSQKELITVNGDKITQKDFDEAYNKEVANSILTQANVDLKAPENRFLYLTKKNHVINKLVLNKIIEQELHKHQIKIDQKDINQELEYIYKQVGGKDVFNKILKAQGFDEKGFKEEIKRGLEVNKLITKVIPAPSVSDSDVKKFYQEKKQEIFYKPKMVRASHILIIANKFDLKEALKKENKNLSESDINNKIATKMVELKTKANKILKQAKNAPDSFKELVTKHSQDVMTYKKDGDLNFFEFEGMPKNFSEAAFSTKPGNVYPNLIQTDIGYHIIKVTDRREEGLVPFNEVKDEIKTSMIEEKKAIGFEKYIDGKLTKSEIKYKDDSYDPQNIQNELKEIIKDFSKSQGKQKVKTTKKEAKK